MSEKNIKTLEEEVTGWRKLYDVLYNLYSSSNIRDQIKEDELGKAVPISSYKQ
jgi:hypothetical protein